MIGLDAMEGKPINKRKHLLSHTDPDDMPTFEEIDQLLKENGIRYSMIIDELQLPAQGTELSEEEKPSTQNLTSTISNKPTRHHTPTNWNNLTTPPWNEQNAATNIHEEKRKTQKSILLPSQSKANYSMV